MNWPPVYDYQELEGQIKRLVAGFLAGKYEFYNPQATTHPLKQGDIVTFSSPIVGIPHLNANLEPDYLELPEQSLQYWLVLGNTCDIVRGPDLVPYSTMLLGIPWQAEMGSLSDFRSGKVYKRLCLPHPAHSGSFLIFSLYEHVLIDREAFEPPKCRIVARLTRDAWILFNAFLVRYLARPDGRDNP